MQDVFGILFLVGFAGLCVAIFGHGVLNRWTGQQWSKKKWFWVMLGITFLFFILVGMTGPKMPAVKPQVSDNQKQAPQQTATSTDSAPAKTEETSVKETPTTSPTTQLAPAAVASDLYDVVKVVDGDTVTVNINGKSETLRLIGINTPETVDPRKSVECFGREASNKAKELLTGKKVKLEADAASGERDKYGRLLRYVFFEDGRSFNKLMISEGYAYEYTYNGIPYKYQAEYKQAQKDAESAKRGLWADNACVVPTAPAPTTPQTPSVDATAAPKPVIIPGVDKDCKDFKTHAEAQAYFIAGGGSPTNNFDKLDADHDGLACESLP